MINKPSGLFLCALILLVNSAHSNEQECKTHFETKQFDLALNTCRASSVEGSASAKHYLGELYMEGQSVEQNQRLALRLIKESAQLGYKPALAKMASLYQSGKYVEKNSEEACDWWARLASANDTLGQEKLGVCFLMGKGREKDIKLGYAYLSVAAKNGSEVAKYIVETYADRFPESAKQDALELAKTLNQ